jgi:hypothetical protein
MLWKLQICSAKRPNYGTRNIFHALQAADMLCEAPELWKTYHISCFGSCRYTLWKRLNYGKRNIFHALQAADMLCEPPELWKTWHISCVGCCRYALRSARTMKNVTYFVLCRLQICSVKRPNYGKRNIFHALQAADMLCESPELWKTLHISCFGGCRYAL